jgi:PhnB protein
MSVNFIPEGFHTITPNTIVADAAKAIEFYRQVFGAEEKLRLTLPDGKIVHCELQIGDSRINLADAMEGWPLHALLAQIYVQDSDAVFARATEAGAKEIMPMTDMFFGAREGRVLDPFGNTWTISTLKEKLTRAEVQRRLDEYAAGAGEATCRPAARASRSQRAQSFEAKKCHLKPEMWPERDYLRLLAR